MKRIFTLTAITLVLALSSTNAAAAEFAAMPVVSTLVSLVVVLVTIGAVALLAKRFGPGGASQTRMLRVVSQLSVGAREKICIVEIDDQWLVLGVTASQITLLTQTPRKETPSALPASQAISFSKLLNLARGKHEAS
jgi:flagellar protein FliO/FliZ